MQHLYKINAYAVQIQFSLDVINDNLRKAEAGNENATTTEPSTNSENVKAAEPSTDNQCTTTTQTEQSNSDSTNLVTPYHPDVLKSNEESLAAAAAAADTN